MMLVCKFETSNPNSKLQTQIRNFKPETPNKESAMTLVCALRPLLCRHSKGQPNPELHGQILNPRT